MQSIWARWLRRCWWPRCSLPSHTMSELVRKISVDRAWDVLPLLILVTLLFKFHMFSLQGFLKNNNNLNLFILNSQSALCVTFLSSPGKFYCTNCWVPDRYLICYPPLYRVPALWRATSKAWLVFWKLIFLTTRARS